MQFAQSEGGAVEGGWLIVVNMQDQLLDQIDVCFVCGLGRNEFERASCDFSEHLASEHNL
jgi:hypothetical protein